MQSRIVGYLHRDTVGLVGRQSDQHWVGLEGVAGLEVTRYLLPNDVVLDVFALEAEVKWDAGVVSNLKYFMLSFR